MDATQWTYSVVVFQTSDGLWHLQCYRECERELQVLNLWSHPRLIGAIDMASALQWHIDNINELPISQYALQSTPSEAREVA